MNWRASGLASTLCDGPAPKSALHLIRLYKKQKKFQQKRKTRSNNQQQHIGEEEQLSLSWHRRYDLVIT